MEYLKPPNNLFNSGNRFHFLTLTSSFSKNNFAFNKDSLKLIIRGLSSPENIPVFKSSQFSNKRGSIRFLVGATPLYEVSNFTEVDIFLSEDQFCIFFSKLVRGIDLILFAS